MNTAPIVEKIRERGFEGSLWENVQLGQHVSLKVGGPAALFAVPASVEDITALLTCLKEEGIPRVLMGHGTNMVFVNGGYGGCVVKLGGPFARIKVEKDSMLSVGAAVPLPAAVKCSAEKGLSGIECLAGIPGSVGGAVFMNAGTRSGEIADVICEVRLFDGMKARWISSGELDFSYRSSGIAEGEIILEARLKLTPSSESEVRSRIEDQNGLRRKTQPSGLPSAGSWFRNPEGDSAGRLIDEAGMKGEKCGGAQVSEVHANFLVNLGGATASDFLTLADKVRERVHARFGVMLEEEVRIIDG
jgi:UDP-N-acetylmuramate dehydrogenase